MKGVIIYSVNIAAKDTREEAEHTLSRYLDEGYQILGQSQSGHNVVYTLALNYTEITQCIGIDGNHQFMMTADMQVVH